jgi:hypothetical protein
LDRFLSWPRGSTGLDSGGETICQTVSFGELAYSNMLTLDAVVELLDKKGKCWKG